MAVGAPKVQDLLQSDDILRWLASDPRDACGQLSVLLEALKLFCISRGVDLEDVGEGLREEGERLNIYLSGWVDRRDEGWR